MERYVIRGGREGYDRLKVLAAAQRQSTLDLLARVGMQPGMRCLDVGCGGGDVALEMARLIGPDGFVVGIDMDEVKLGLARDAARELGLTNVELRAANVNDWTEPDAYDLVYSRFLLQHLRRPVDLLGRMWAATRAGGALVVEDADFDGAFCEPPSDGHAFWLRTYRLVLERNGGDPAFGRKLYGAFLDAGVPSPEVRLDHRVDVSGPAKTMPRLTLEATADLLVRRASARSTRWRRRGGVSWGSTTTRASSWEPPAPSRSGPGDPSPSGRVTKSGRRGESGNPERGPLL